MCWACFGESRENAAEHLGRAFLHRYVGLASRQANLARICTEAARVCMLSEVTISVDSAVEALPMDPTLPAA
eukprot:2241578-Amphidinium_carterae.1